MHWLLWCVVAMGLRRGAGQESLNSTLDLALDPASRQLLDFRLQHPEPIGVWTTSAGKPVDVRESVNLNRDVFNNPLFYDLQSSLNRERIPERIVHAKGAGAYGYFEVTNDVSKYTKADVFNDIGKKTPVFVRFSLALQNTGGRDLERDILALVVKYYTNEGNLDMLTFHVPVFIYRDPMSLFVLAHALKRNPKTNLLNDATTVFDFVIKSPDTLHIALWFFSDFGIPFGYRKLDAFPIHTYEVTNRHGESYFVRFNYRTEQGQENLTTEEATLFKSLDPDFAVRDLYNAIAEGRFPSWRLDMDVMSKDKIDKLDYNPFDVTRLWENGTYETVTIGRLILNRNPDNFFKDVEQAAFNPGNLVPGIPGPRDLMFKARRFAYRDAQNYRLGINHNKIEVNCPKYSKVYNRDGVPPVLDNMRDAPNYYQNSFKGPAPFVDTERPKESITILDRAAVDLQPSADFYNNYLPREDQKVRLAENIAGFLANAVQLVQRPFIKLLYQVDRDLGRRVELALVPARAAVAALRATQRNYRPVLSLIPQTAPNNTKVPDLAGKDATPEAPVETENLTETVKTTLSEKDVIPEKPVEIENLAETVKPTLPEKDVTPEKPVEIENLAETVKPTLPEKDVTPEKPVEIENLAETVQPTLPEKDVTPMKPAQIENLAETVKPTV